MHWFGDRSGEIPTHFRFRRLKQKFRIPINRNDLLLFGQFEWYSTDESWLRSLLCHKTIGTFIRSFQREHEKSIQSKITVNFDNGNSELKRAHDIGTNGLECYKLSNNAVASETLISSIKSWRKKWCAFIYLRQRMWQTTIVWRRHACRRLLSRI